MARAILFDAPGPPGPQGKRGPAGAPGPRADNSVDVRDFGAKCDGSTDDSAALQGANNSLTATGGTILFPSGKTCVIRQDVTLNVSGVILKGSGASVNQLGPGATIKLENAGFIIPSVQSLYFKDLNVFVQGQHAFRVPVGATPSDLHWDDVTGVHFDATSSFIKVGSSTAANQGAQALKCDMFRCQVFGGAGQSVPLIALYGVSGGLNNWSFEKCWFEGPLVSTTSTAPLVAIEATDNGLIANMSFKDTIFELPLAGAVKFRSVSRSGFYQVWAGDLGGATPSAPIFDFDKSVNCTIGCQELYIDSLQCDAGSAADPTKATILWVGASGNSHFLLSNSSIQSFANAASAVAGTPNFLGFWVGINNNIPVIFGDGPKQFDANEYVLDLSYTTSDTATHAVLTTPIPTYTLSEYAIDVQAKAGTEAAVWRSLRASYVQQGVTPAAVGAEIGTVTPDATTSGMTSATVNVVKSGQNLVITVKSGTTALTTWNVRTRLLQDYAS